LRKWKEKNRVVSFSSSTAQGLCSTINEWFLKNLDEADSDIKYFSGLDFYFSNSSKTHCAILHWVEIEEDEESEN